VPVQGCTFFTWYCELNEVTIGHNYTLDKTVIKCTQNFVGKCLEKQPLGRQRKGLDNSKTGLRQTGYEDGRYKE
jgi:hypothetical protein